MISKSVLFWNLVSQINSKWILQNRWGNKNEVLSNIQHKYMNDLLYPHLYLIYIWKYICIKKSSTFANPMMEKPGNWIKF